MASTQEKALSWNEFQAKNKGKFNREELSAQWKEYKKTQANKQSSGPNPLSSWLKKKKNEVMQDTASEKDNERTPKETPSTASSHLPRPSSTPPTETSSQAHYKGRHSGPIGRLYKALKREARRMFSSSSSNQPHLTTQRIDPVTDPAYQASLIAAAWAAEAERAAKEAQRLHKEEQQEIISRKQQGPLGDRLLRTINRETLPHDHDAYFKLFSPWILVATHNLRSVRSLIPFSPGVYEWGCSAPGDDKNRIFSFYLGKAGTLKQGKRKMGAETIRTRFSHYTRGGNGFIGPEAEAAKYSVFVDLQRRGFSIWFRWRPLQDVEPVDLETWILTRVSYPLNLINNGARRRILLGDGRSIEDYPIVKR